MGIIKIKYNDNDRPSGRYGPTLNTIAKALLNEECLILLGAGASFSKESPSLPTAYQLSKEMAEESALEWHETIPLSTISFYYEFFRDRDMLNDFLVQRIDDDNIKPGTTLTTLIDIIKILEEKEKGSFVVTTNYDRHFEKAYKEKFGEEPGVIIYNGGTDPNKKGVPLHQELRQPAEFWQHNKSDHLTYLYKIHGCISKPDNQNLVITEEDYINFLSNSFSQDPEKRLLTYLRGRFALSTVLFIGYSLADWNFRVIFKATKERIDTGKKSYAIQYYNPEHQNSIQAAAQEALVDFWGKKDVDIMNIDASQFMKDLLTEMESITTGDLTNG